MMSRQIAGETLKAIPAGDFLKTHSQIESSSKTNRSQAIQFYKDAPYLFALGRHLMSRTKRAGWEPQFPSAIRAGSNLLFLTTLAWLKPEQPTPAEIETRKWLTSVELTRRIAPEIIGLTELSYDTDAVAYAAEDELANYPAFVALGHDIEPALFERGVDIKIGAIVRLGIGLGSVALKRELEENQPEGEVKIGAAQLDELEDWFNLSP